MFQDIVGYDDIKYYVDIIKKKYSDLGLSNVMDILKYTTLLVRMPLRSDKISGFVFYKDNIFVVFLNSAFTLGHEMFTAAHELYHIECNKDLLREKKLIVDRQEIKDILDENEKKADKFAAEFLMPEMGVKKLFNMYVNVGPYDIKPEHIVRLQNIFKVSYRAMTKRLIELGLCAKEKEEELKEIGSLGREEKLKQITKTEGYSYELITPSNSYEISPLFIMFSKENYINRKISYGKLEELFGLINKKPLDFECYKFDEENNISEKYLNFIEEFINE